MSQIIVRTLKVPTYNSKVIVLLYHDTNESTDAANRYLKRKGFNARLDATDAGMQFSQTLRHNKHRFVLAVSLTSHAIETGAHEIFHLVQDIMEYHGVEYRKGTSNEAFAYLTGILAGKIIPIILEHVDTTSGDQPKHIRKPSTVHVHIHESGRVLNTPGLLSEVQAEAVKKTSGNEVRDNSNTSEHNNA